MRPISRSLKLLPNAITFSRLLLGTAAFMAAVQQHWVAAFWLLLVALATDFFDGMAARKFNASSKFGEEFDAVTDSLIIVLGMLSLGISGHLSWVIVTLVLMYGLVISSDRVFTQPAWRWRTLFGVASLFVGWVGIVWFYAALAYGWSWFYVLITIVVLALCGILKRGRIATWMKG